MRIEQRLKHLSDENPNYALLWAQWEFDKKLLTRALNTISRDFPHYSLHDSSHSSTIINQIEKVIAPNIEKLSATDCWLILESCYWHDAGMIITNEEKMELLKDNRFIIYLQDLCESDSDLSSYAKTVLGEKNKNDITRALLISNALTFVIADYFRKIHANRSSENVVDPDRIRVSSPRTSLIPPRLFNFVAEIVQCHGKKKESILEIAKYNDGMDAQDYAHPRYVAALLRIGDLLDIDDGRFCPTLLSNIGDIPRSSLDHQHKHASIKHLYIDSNVIEIKAECEMYGGYHAQQAWFNYIETEFDYQKRVWNDIVPATDYRALPTLGILSCTIKDYITIDGKVPTLSLDHKRVYSYITGSQIYSENLPFIRELIQNSVDAIYYKVWEELIEDEFFNKKPEEEKRVIFNQSLAENKIDVTYEKSQSKNDDNISFCVKDTGTGMCIDDIKKFLRVGSESLSNRKVVLRTMPDWARPSGFFGIGLQAVFKSCTEVVIHTKKIENPYYEIVIRNDNNDNYDISIREIKGRRTNGTEIKATFNSDVIKNISFESLRFYERNKLLTMYDALDLDDDLYFHHYVRNIIDNDFSQNNILISLSEKELYREIPMDVEQENKTDVLPYETDYLYGVDFSLKVGVDILGGLNFKYKGVGFELNNGFSGIVGVINIFNNDAGYWLTIDRKKGRTDRVKELNALIDNVVKNNEEIIRNNTENKALADFFYFSKYDSSCNQLWREYSIAGHTLEEYLYLGETLSVYKNNSFMINAAMPYIHETRIELLRRLVKKLEMSIHVELSPQKFSISEGRFADLTYNISFRNDGKRSFRSSIELIKEEIKIHRRGKFRRSYFSCFDDKYEDICIGRSYVNSLMVTSSSFFNWFDNVLIGPKEIDWTEQDLNNLLNFYKKKGCLKVTDEKFKELYSALWNELRINH
ncbi:HD domain-containing protein [Enterobacter mori]|uniref:HD domain-containing protein n=1 Tax=Enterobacter mori TaxID=539813 RepID=UPI0026E3897B|nr:ATP-binding protein [Enterobacter mori]WKW36610.1 ATP-binding protein [Enterobacter mori]